MARKRVENPGCPCKSCGGATRVIDSRPSEKGINRRRECVKCGVRFSTVERDVDDLVEEIARWLEELKRPKMAKALRVRFE